MWVCRATCKAHSASYRPRAAISRRVCARPGSPAGRAVAVFTWFSGAPARSSPDNVVPILSITGLVFVHGSGSNQDVAVRKRCGTNEFEVSSMRTAECAAITGFVTPCSRRTPCEDWRGRPRPAGTRPPAASGQRSGRSRETGGHRINFKPPRVMIRDPDKPRSPVQRRKDASISRVRSPPHLDAPHGRSLAPCADGSLCSS